ncbi:MAG: protein kinase [Sandaracinaceae bacterium]|nr:protein kinase [Sandaracinaceae bacterium]
MVEVQQDAGETDKMIGKVMLGRYRIVKMLGEGGMGRVYLAEQKMGAATRKVAIKTLHPELSGDPQLVARFNRESETVIELSHPNTIQFYDFGELEDKTLFIVMEFIEGESLASLLQRGPIEATRADKLLIQICGSLHEAHVRGIVHRDLKPENILLTNRGGQSDFVKVLDFGIAKRSEAEDASKGKLTKQGMVLGTPPYMSPEQFSGQELDARSDIYSLGIMVYEMLTGRLPFEAKTPWEWATKHLTAAPEALENTPAGATVSAVRKAAIMRALAKNRDQRQATVHVFLQEFTGHQDAQAAWTMATSGVSPMPSPNTQGPPTGRTPIGTPNQIQHMTPVPSTYTSDPTMAAPQITGPVQGHAQSVPSVPTPYQQQHTPTPVSYGGYQTPVPGQQGGGAYHPYTGSMEASGSTAKKNRGAGKLIAIGVVALCVVVGGGVGGAYWMMNSGGSANATTANADSGRTAGTTPPVGTSGATGTATSPTTNPTSVDPATEENKPQVQHVVPPVENAATQPANPPVSPPTNPAVNPPAHPPATPPRNPRPPEPAPSAAQEQAARVLIGTLNGQLSRNDLEGAVTTLNAAQRTVGRHNPMLEGVRQGLERKGNIAIGILLQQGRCPLAQALYRRLHSVNAEDAARGQFDPEWCARP